MEFNDKIGTNSEGIDVIEKLIAEVAYGKMKLPTNMRQQIFLVFKTLTTDIVMLNLERDRKVVTKKYKDTKAKVLALKESVVALLAKIDMARKQVLSSIDEELTEMLVLLEHNKDQCMSEKK